MRTTLVSCWIVFFCCAIAPASAHLPFEVGADHHDHAEEVVDPSPPALQRSQFARARLTAFRRNGDDGELARAWLYLEQDLKRASPPFETLLVAAFVVQAQHHFDDALAYLERAAKVRPLDDEAVLLKASLHMLAGDRAQTVASCRQLSLENIYLRMFCAGRAATLQGGDAASAYAKLAPLIGQLDAAPELAAWARSVLGDLAVASGNTETAIGHYEQALLRAERTQVRAALVDQLVASGRWQAAWRHLASPGQALALHVRRFVVARQLGKFDQVAAQVAQTDRSFRRWMARGDWLHAREMSRFYLDVMPEPYLANRLARINYLMQKEPEDARLVQRTL